MLRFIPVLVLSFFLLSCDKGPTVATDGYIFTAKQYEKETVTINIVSYKTRDDLLKAARAKGQNDPNIAAFAVLRPPRFDVCEVHIIDPQTSYEPEFLGHEFAHCVYGQWHTSNKARG